MSSIFWLAILLAFYILLCIAFWFFQDFLIFRPERLPDDFTFKYPYPFEEIFIKAGKNARINGIHFRVPNSKGVILYFKGNTRSVKGWAKFAKHFLHLDHDFLLMDYRGFGKSRGERTEKLLFKDAQLAYKYLLKQYPEDKIIIYGRSIGSGFATYLASKHNPKLLILDSPYLSFQYIARRYAPFLPLKLLLRYKIRTDLFIRRVNIPIFIFHGEKDFLIPFKHAVKLANINRRQTHLIRIPKGKHNNLNRIPEYHIALYDILSGYTNRTSLYEEVF